MLLSMHYYQFKTSNFMELPCHQETDLKDYEPSSESDCIPSGSEPELACERRAFLKMLLGSLFVAEAAINCGGREEPTSSEDTGQTEMTVEEPDEIKKFLKELFAEKEFGKISPPPGKINQQYCEKWLRRYRGADTNYRGPLNKTLLNGWSTFLDSGEYKTVSRILKDEKVPLFFVFLAAAESEFNHQANSNMKAKGMWQFIPETAASYGLLAGNWNKRHKRIVTISKDHRNELEPATKAACKLLKDLFDMVESWEKAVNRKHRDKAVSLSESDKWFWAMCAYNRSPARVYKTFIKTTGDPADYIATCPNNESDNYAARIFAIAQFLKESFESGKPLISKIDKAEVEARASQCEADRLYDKIKPVLQEDISNPQEIVDELQRVLGVYNKELTAGKISAEYRDGALEVVMHDISVLKQKFPDQFTTIEAVNGLAVAVATDPYGETEIEKVTKPQSTPGLFQSAEQILEKVTLVEDLDIAPYTLRPLDNLGKIATWLSGDRQKVFAVQNLIKKLNPQITNWNKLDVGQSINVPSKMIEVPQIGLNSLLDQYYPGVITQYTAFFYNKFIRHGANPKEAAKANAKAVKKAYQQAEMYLKWINGKNPNSKKPADRIKPGEIIYVPAVS